MPCGTYLSHADSADFRRQCLFINVIIQITRLALQDGVLCILFLLTKKEAEQNSVYSECSVWDKIFDRRIKEHIFLLTQRRKVSQSVYVVLRAIISHRTESRCPNLWGESNPRNTQNPAGWDGLTQTAQTFADNVYLSTWLYRLHGWFCRTEFCVSVD